MKSIIIDNETLFLSDLQFLFPDADVVNHKDVSLDLLESYDYVVLSGGPIHISYDSDLIEVKKFLRTTSKPVFGICLGFEIMAVTFGSSLLPLSKPRKGFFPFFLENNEGSLFQSHSWFIKDVPLGFEVLSSSDNIIECIKHKSKPFFGIQGHPEKSTVFGEQLRDYFIENYVKNFKSA